MDEELVVGQHPKNTYWAVRGDTGVSQSHLHLFHECGVRSKAYNGTVWVLDSLKFLRPFDKVNSNHMSLFNYYDNYILNSKPTVSDEHYGMLPFSTFNIVDYRAMVIVGGDGPKTNWWSEWKDGLLYVHEDYETKTYKPYTGTVSSSSQSTTDNDNKHKNKVKVKPVEPVEPVKPVKPVRAPVVESSDSGEDMFGLFD